MMVQHIPKKMAIKMTTSQKYDYKTEGYKKAWDPMMSITAYFTGLDKFQISLADRGILTSVEEKAMATGAQMWESKMFTEDQMVAWENRLCQPDVDKSPDLVLHGEVAQKAPVLSSHGKTVTLQRSRTGSAGASSGNGRGQNTSNDVCAASRAAPVAA
jgi:hypothetical protein